MTNQENPSNSDKKIRPVEEKEIIERLVKELANKYNYDGSLLRIKWRFEHVIEKFGGIDNVKGKRILDLGCGHTLDKEVAEILTKRRKENPQFDIDQESYEILVKKGAYDTLIEGIPGSREYEPWLCRALSFLGADPVGIDLGNLDGEEFEHYQIDLSKPGALDFLPDKSFDFINSEAFGSSPQLEMMTTGEERKEMGQEMKKQVERLLKDGGQTYFNNFFEEKDY